MLEDSQIPTSMPVHTEQPQASAAVPASLLSGRGRQLTAQQEATLVEICKQQHIEGRYANKTKKFWCWVSDSFKRETGRAYSWQSCRRRMTRLEEEGRLQQPPTPSPVPSAQDESPGVKHSESITNQDEPMDETDRGHDGEDDDLPPVPFSIVRRSDSHARYDHENQRVSCFVNQTMVIFETRLREFSPAIIKDKDDLRDVLEAFDRFKEQFHKALEIGKRGKCGQKKGGR